MLVNSVLIVKLARMPIVLGLCVPATASAGLIGAFAVPDSKPFSTFAYGINDDGFVAGTYQDTSGAYRGFVRNSAGDSYTTIAVPGSSYTSALGIDNSGDVMGLFAVSFQWHAYLRRADGTFGFFDIPGVPSHSIIGLSINDNAQFVGSYLNGNTFSSFLCSQFNQPCMTLSYPGADSTVAKGTNDRNQIVGYYTSNGRTHGFVRNPDDSYLSLDAPEATISTRATGISSDGKIVGSYDGRNGQQSFIRSADGSQFSTLDLGSDTSFVTGVNASGTVTGFVQKGFDKYLGFTGTATPVPEPSLALLIGSGLVWVLLRKNKHRTPD